MSTLRNIIIFRFPVDKRETLDFISYVHKLFSSVRNAVNGVLEAKVAKKNSRVAWRRTLLESHRRDHPR